jgi:hypothetical protein
MISSLFINFSHHPQLALKGILLFLAHYFAFDIKAFLVTSNPLFHKYFKYSKTETSISRFLPFLGPEKDYLSDMKTVLFSYFANNVHMPHCILSTSCTITYLSAHIITLFLVWHSMLNDVA